MIDDNYLQNCPRIAFVRDEFSVLGRGLGVYGFVGLHLNRGIPRKLFTVWGQGHFGNSLVLQ